MLCTGPLAFERKVPSKSTGSRKSTRQVEGALTRGEISGPEPPADYVLTYTSMDK